MPESLGRPPVSSQFGVNGSSNGELRPCWICRSIVVGESPGKEAEMGGMLNSEVRICPKQTQQVCLPGRDRDSSADVQIISSNSTKKYLSDKM